VGGLDHPDLRDYVGGNPAVFDGEPDAGTTDGLTSCYHADLGNEITGGTVTWLGSGIFAARSSHINVEMTGGAQYRCTMKAMAMQNIEVELHMCRCENCPTPSP